MMSKLLGIGFVTLAFGAGCTSTMNEAKSAAPEGQQSFPTAEAAGDALVHAAASYDVPKLVAILGPDGKDLITSEDRAGDENRARAFATKGSEKRSIAVDPNDSESATLLVGNDDWPLP